MKVLFFMPEQYVNWEDEPCNYELRLPILNCGLVTEHRDFCYQCLLRAEGRDSMNRKALREVLEFQPDLVVYGTSWPQESIAPVVFHEIMRHGIPVFAGIFDTQTELHLHELEWLINCNYFGLADSITNYDRFCSLSRRYPQVRGVLFMAGNNVFTDTIRKVNEKKIYDVTVLGSAEAHRVQLIEFLSRSLPKYGIKFHKFGGLVDSRRGEPPSDGLRLTDRWVPWNEYVSIINQSKICISSQTSGSRMQLKGKVFHYLACGTLCLSDANPELKRVVPKNCLVTYHSIEDCLEKIVYYMANDDERQSIAGAGHRWFRKTFDYKAFWSRFLRAAAGRQRFFEIGFKP